jgi:cell division septum initiation protein DivIVA
MALRIFSPDEEHQPSESLTKAVGDNTKLHEQLTAADDAVGQACLSASALFRELRNNQDDDVRSWLPHAAPGFNSLIDDFLIFRRHRYDEPDPEAFATAAQGAMFLEAYERSKDTPPANRILSLSEEHRSQYLNEATTILHELASINKLASNYTRYANLYSNVPRPQEIQEFLDAHDAMEQKLSEISEAQRGTNVQEALPLRELLNVSSIAAQAQIQGKKGAA